MATTTPAQRELMEIEQNRLAALERRKEVGRLKKMKEMKETQERLLGVLRDPSETSAVSGTMSTPLYAPLYTEFPTDVVAELYKGFPNVVEPLLEDVPAQDLPTSVFVPPGLIDEWMAAPRGTDVPLEDFVKTNYDTIENWVRLQLHKRSHEALDTTDDKSDAKKVRFSIPATQTFPANPVTALKPTAPNPVTVTAPKPTAPNKKQKASSDIRNYLNPKPKVRPICFRVLTALSVGQSCVATSSTTTISSSSSSSSSSVSKFDVPVPTGGPAVGQK